MKKRTHILITLLALLFYLVPCSMRGANSDDAKNYIVLQQHKSLKSQLTKENTIYEIRYDFDMHGTSLMAPVGTVLKFTGGMIRNSPSLYNIVDIDAPAYQIFDNVDHVSSIGVLYPQWFGAKGDGIHDDTKAIQNAINAQINYTAVYFKRGTYKTTATIVIPVEMKYSKIFGDVSAKIKAEHNGNCFEFTPQDIEAGHIVFENLSIIGPNNYYGSFASNISQGAGIAFSHAYNNLIENCIVSGFKYGLRITTGIGNDAVRTSFRFCEYGIYLDGKATNLNRFQLCNIRENRREGVHIEGAEGSPALQNEFTDCYIEANHPYMTKDICKEVGIAFSLSWADFTSIHNCYLESQYTFFNFENYTTSSRIVDCRLAVHKQYKGHSIFRYNSEGKTIRGNRIVRCSMQSMTQNESSIGFSSFNDGDNYSQDIYEDCSGLVIPERLLSDRKAPHFINAIPNISYGGNYGKLLNLGAIYQNLGFNESNSIPYIEKNEAGCVLHVNGYGHIVLGNLINEPITINHISGLNIGDVVVIEGFDLPYPVIFKHTKNKLGLGNEKDLILPSKSDMKTVVFFKDYQGNVVELSRNF